jgi:hypothetical protein
MPKLKLTASNVEALTAKNGRRTDYWDEIQRGLALHISPSGKKTWVAFYRTGRRFRRLTISDYPTMGLANARKRANAAMLQVADGRDPAAEKVRRRDEITFEDLAFPCLARHCILDPLLISRLEVRFLHGSF